MLRKILLLSLVLSLSGCALFKTKPDVQVTTVAREPLNLPTPAAPTFEKSKNIKWKIEGEKVTTDRNSFIGFMEDLIDYSKYNERLRETLRRYQEYTDNPETKK